MLFGTESGGNFINYTFTFVICVYIKAFHDLYMISHFILNLETPCVYKMLHMRALLYERIELPVECTTVKWGTRKTKCTTTSLDERLL